MNNNNTKHDHRTRPVTLKFLRRDEGEHVEQQVFPRQCRIDEFFAYLPRHEYIYIADGRLWPVAAIDGNIPWQFDPQTGDFVKPSKYLDKYRPVMQMSWVPGAPQLIEGYIYGANGKIRRPNTCTFNLYIPPPKLLAQAPHAGPWVDHLKRLYPENWQHLQMWFAHHIQKPGTKVNHALVLGGAPGIGKDTLLAPLRIGVGEQNYQDIAPRMLLGDFNSFAAQAIIIRISESRDIGDSDRRQLHEVLKGYTAAPPEMLRVNRKRLEEYYVPNVCGVVITTNYRTSALYLPPDDRRHYVAWSEAHREDFPETYFAELWSWLERGGAHAVVAYLEALDLTSFDPKRPPPQTDAFWAIVNASESPEVSDLRDVVNELGAGVAVSVEDVASKAASLGKHDLANDLRDRQKVRRVAAQFSDVGLSAVKYPGEKGRGRWTLRDGGRVMLYADAKLDERQRQELAKLRAAGMKP